MAEAISDKTKKERALVIVESPAKSKTIKKILGDNYQIEASFGHVRNLPLKDPATDNLGLSYYQAGDKKDVYYNSNINISKSSENNIITLSLSSNLSASYQFNNARANKTFKLNSNNNAFVRS